MADSTVTQYLWRALARDRFKCEPCIQGWRSTHEVANNFGWSMATARRRLQAAFDDGLIECCGPSPFEWYVRPGAGNDDDGEPLPVAAAA